MIFLILLFPNLRMSPFRVELMHLVSKVELSVVGDSGLCCFVCLSESYCVTVSTDRALFVDSISLYNYFLW